MTEADLPPLPLPASVATGTPVTSQIQDSCDGNVVPPGDTSETAADPFHAPFTRLWYLGVGEALLWFFGALTVHLVGGIALMVFAIVIRSVATGNAPTATLDPETMLIVTAGEMASFVCLAILAVTIRYWGRTFRELNFSLPEFRHVAIVVGATLPLSLCTSAWSVPIQLGWNQYKQAIPFYEFLDDMNAMEMVKEMARSTPLPLMILIVALLPAIGEELVFRGAIGRVLIAHLGIWTGVILTSILFGFIHIHPVHALSVIPLGIAMHVIYLWTRSFWMPMLLHFLNNSWASLASQSDKDEPLRHPVMLSPLEYIEMFSAILSVVFLTIVLWKSRVRWFRDNGEECFCSQFPVLDPSSSTCRRGTSRISSFYWLAAIVSVVVCHLAVIADLVGSLLGEL